MEIFILLFGYVISFHVSMLEAMFHTALDTGVKHGAKAFGPRTRPPDIRPGDFVSVHIRGLEPHVAGGIYTGNLIGTVQNIELLPKCTKEYRFFARVSHGVYYADLVHRPAIGEDVGGPHRCFIEGQEDKDKGREEIFFSADLTPVKLSGTRNVWMQKHIRYPPYILYMWGVDLEQCKQKYIPPWAFKKNVEAKEQIGSSHHQHRLLNKYEITEM